MKLTREEVINILEYNMTMLTCDMSISRDPEHQDVPPDYYGKDAEELYYACEYCLALLKNDAIPVDWIKRWLSNIKNDPRYKSEYGELTGDVKYVSYEGTKVTRIPCISDMLEDWEKENDKMSEM